MECVRCVVIVKCTAAGVSMHIDFCDLVKLFGRIHDARNSLGEGSHQPVWRRSEDRSCGEADRGGEIMYISDLRFLVNISEFKELTMKSAQKRTKVCSTLL